MALGVGEAPAALYQAKKPPDLTGSGGRYKQRSNSPGSRTSPIKSVHGRTCDVAWLSR